MRAKLLTSVVILACLVIFTPRTACAKSWKGVVPLHSTRADVERLLGAPNFEDSGYEVEEGRVLISYSSQGCQEGLPGGWKVPTDTVTSISLTPTKEIKLADLLVTGKQYEQVYAVHTRQVAYVDIQEGVRYGTLDGAVLDITYFASEADDEKLRCGDYKYAAPVPAGAKNKFEQIPYDSYGKMPFADAEARFDSFLLQLENLNRGKPHYRGFVIVYAGRSAHVAEGSTMAECAKSYLVSVRKADPDTVIAVDGGYRDAFLVELYIIPNDAYPPMLLPTVSPKKVEILPGTVSPCSP